MRLLLCGSAACVVVVALFLFMAQLANPTARYQTAETSVGLNMLRMRFDSDVQLRDRTLPPPPPPVTQTETAQAVAAKAPSVDVPTLDMPHMAFESNFELALSTPSLPSISAPAEVVVQGDLVMENAPRQRINPQYPRRAQQRKIEGYVIVEFRVDEEGRVDRDSLEFVEANPEGIFERVVRKAVFRWRFDPLMQNGVAVAYKNRQRFEFNLEN